MEAVDESCRERGIRCVYLCTDAADAETPRVAAANGFRVVDVLVISRRSYEGLFDLPSGPAALTVREATGDDLEFARDLAARSHHTSRFYFDGNFPRDRCDALYEAWVERGHRDPERRLLIGVVGGEPVGYMICAPLGPEGEGHGELIAIEQRHRGKGFGRALHFGEYRDFAKRGARTHRGVMSTGNIASIDCAGSSASNGRGSGLAPQVVRVMSPPCEVLEWDSGFFGFRVARVLGSTFDREAAGRVDEWSRANEVRCLYLLAEQEDPETSRVAAESGFRVVDLRITIRRSLEGVAELPFEGPDGWTW